jgi:SAM-dependent methyltransferase
MYIEQPERVLINKAIAKFAPQIRGKVLDVGAGMSDRYSTLFTCDSYTRMDTSAREGIDLVGTAEHIPVPDSSYDAVVCTQVLGDVEDPRVVVREFFRVLKPSGSVLLSEALFNALHDQPHDYWRFTPHTFKMLFTEAGFSSVTVETLGGFWSVGAQQIIRYCIERFNLYNHSRVWSFPLKYLSRFSMWLDRHDHSHVNSLYPHGCVVLATK